MLKFKIGKLSIQINFMFVAIVTLFLILDRTGISVIALLACFIHEMAHIVAFIAVGYVPKKLSFEITGIRLTKPVQALSYKKELIVQFAGSFANLTIFFILINTINKISLLSIFAVTHLVIGVFNLLPIKSFDGGKILEIILSKFLSDEAVQKICTAVDFLCIFLMLAACIVLIVFSKKSFTLIIMAVYLLICSGFKLFKRY